MDVLGIYVICIYFIYDDQSSGETWILLKELVRTDDVDIFELT